MITLREAEMQIRTLHQAEDLRHTAEYAYNEVLSILAEVYRGPETSVHNGVNEAFNALISGEPGNTATAEPTTVVDLMAALEASLAGAKARLL